MYSLLKGYVSKKPPNEDEEIAEGNSSKRSSSVVRFRSRPDPSSTASSGYGAGYLSWGWNTVSYLGGQIKQGINKTLAWDPIPQAPQIEALSMASKPSVKGKRQKPDGCVEYTVTNNDTVAKIALKFDTTPSELTRLNRLPSHMLFPGQVLFVPDHSNSDTTASNLSDSTAESVKTAPQPSNASSLQQNSNNKVLGSSQCHHGKVRLTKTVSLSDEEEEITEHFLKIVAKYITDGQGVVSGVLLVTPHSVMFNPNVSDPLVLERGRDLYCINTPMSAITSAAMYHDIAAMAIHDPLKHGRFHLDAATAQSLSRQNSSEVDVSPVGSPRSSRLSSTLDNIEENSPADENPKNSPDSSHSKRVRHLSNTEEPVPIEIDRGLGENITQITKDFNQEDTHVRELPLQRTQDDELMNIVNGILNDIITDVVSKECRVKPIIKDFITMADPVSGGERDNTCASPGSEDSGISCSVTRNKLHSENALPSVSHNKRLSESTDTDLSQESCIDSGRSLHREEKQRSSSFLSSVSGEVKYWLGLGQRTASKEDEEEIISRPASSNPEIQPLYLCIRISKKHWCICLAGERVSGASKGENLVNRDRRRREYWFAIPPSRVEHVYGFFKQWCPSIHNTMSEEESGDEDHAIDTSTELADEEAIQFVDVFFGSTPPKPKVEPPKPTLPKLTMETRTGRHTSSDTVRTPDVLSEDMVFLPEMLSESQILSECMIKTLSSQLPSRTIGHSWVLVYSTFVHGFSLKTLYRNMEYYDSPMLIIIQDDEHQVFGALSSCPLRMSDGFYGTGESFLFKYDEEQLVKKYGWSGENNFFMKGSRDCIAFGSGGGHFGLWLDEDFYHGTSSRSETYNNERLSKHDDFLCSGLEAWTFD